jgi:hypothetical protein
MAYFLAGPVSRSAIPFLFNEMSGYVPDEGLCAVT